MLALVLKREAVSNRKQAVVGLRGACRHEHQVLNGAAKPFHPELGPLRDKSNGQAPAASAGCACAQGWLAPAAERVKDAGKV